MSIAVDGTGYMGLKLDVLLSQCNKLTAVDIIFEKVTLINQRRSPVVGWRIEDCPTTRNLEFSDNIDTEAAYC